MQETIIRNCVRAAVQRVMFCPRCSTILDTKKAVLVSGRETAPEAMRGARVLCADCFAGLRKGANANPLQVGGMFADGFTRLVEVWTGKGEELQESNLPDPIPFETWFRSTFPTTPELPL